MTLDDDARFVLAKTGGQAACYSGCGSGMGACHDNLNAQARRLALSRLGLKGCQHPDRSGMEFKDGSRRLECVQCHEVWLYHANGEVWV